ncbi:SUMF1/EgtB/PvdO family nonheme iron enzyme [Beggiatoa leptomitoformis]|uniref:SUMF1/EgtB/PvdO family nonheme iron enzyme n=1 Tax=Beggiatoa leptomitoformis TaxID=288004 RepID=A0A2N9YJ13_9GAMM|nr:SUMF1/EgtB/PvdO family nonheme iron enzyme [Beggiatoa leptomitoformis]AUI70512.2 SUMF1/EgtB/PvdO family nonheme iron enzyme [Beggiatoa leptomitoformis]QGX03506.1 SUMF1/EgtB/PvdO family nonheme iron enzyme [Beggiatoa leptomitoformis]
MIRYGLLSLLILTSPIVQAVDKYALVIGIGNYSDGWQLTNPVNDAEDVSVALKNVGFRVTKLVDVDKRQINQEIQNFASSLQNGDVALFFFSGHGFSGENIDRRMTNFLVGSFDESVRTETALQEKSVDVQFVIRSLRERNRGGINIVVLDACRNIPERFRREQKGFFNDGLVSLGKYERFVINYATQPLQVALGNDKSRNSAYTKYFIRGLQNNALINKNITEFFNEVGLQMVEEFGEKQTPVVEAPPIRFCLANCETLTISPAPAIPEQLPQPLPKTITNSLGMELVLIPAGSFMMGSNDGSPDEKPVHKVKIDKPFYMGKYEVTVGEFRTFIAESGYKTEAEKGDGCYGWTGSSWEKKKEYNWKWLGFKQEENHPVACVSWNDAVAYTEWLSQKTGKTYRLPTEAEWEYAARGGSLGKWYFGDDESQLENYAWYGDNSGNQTHAVGQKRSNQYGLYDMAGNVWEWTCSDYTSNGYDGSELVLSKNSNKDKTLRGGSWSYYSDNARSANRADYAPTIKGNYVGFRLVVISP